MNRMETIRAWENVLLLDDNDPEAMTYLGVCLIGFNRRSRAHGGGTVHCGVATAGAGVAEPSQPGPGRHLHRVYRCNKGDRSSPRQGDGPVRGRSPRAVQTRG